MPDDDFVATRRRLAGDAHRPLYHFLPPANWMNDPNGLIQYGGRYHLFYQCNPSGPTWENIHWGSAVSEDLVHWTDRPVALAPTPGSADADGCWSGCAVDHDGTPTLIYTGGRGSQQLPCLATSGDDLLSWRKYPGNPIIAAPPSELDVIGFRDPMVWRDSGTWYQVLGSGLRGVAGAVLLYRSSDLLQWQYVGPLLVGDGASGLMWECPDFFPLDGRHVLVVSSEFDRVVQAFAGPYQDHRFRPERRDVVDYGRYFYAPRSLSDTAGRRLMWGWIREGRGDAAAQAAGWAGVMSLPRVLSMRADGALGMSPAPELAVLRGARNATSSMPLPSDSRTVLDDVAGACLEIQMVLEPGESGTCGIVVRRTPDGREETRIGYDVAASRLWVDRACSSLDPEVDREPCGGRLLLAPGEPLSLHIFLDCSVLEIFANGRLCLTDRIYPTRPDAGGIALFAEGGPACVMSLDIWNMTPVWPSHGRVGEEQAGS